MDNDLSDEQPYDLSDERTQEILRWAHDKGFRAGMRSGLRLLLALPDQHMRTGATTILNALEDYAPEGSESQIAGRQR